MHRRLPMLFVFTLLMLVASALPASARIGTSYDDRADVLVYDWWSDDSDYTSWPHDISRLKLNNDTDGSRRIGARINFHSLKSWAWDTATVLIDTDGDGGVEYRFEQDRYWDDGPSVYRGRYGVYPVCKAAFTVDSTNDVMTFSAPRACFGSPGPIRGKADVDSQWGNMDLDCCHDWAWDEMAWSSPVRRG